MTSGRSRLITADEVRAAMFGTPVEAITVVRQAWRLSDDDSDELALISARGSWWVARRMSDRLTVWAYAGDLEAERGFDALVTAARAGESAWHEATRTLLTT